MKTPNAAFVLLFGSLLAARAQGPTTATAQANVPAPTDYQVVQADGNSRIWQRATYEAGPNGGVTTNLQTYTELASGLNHLINSQWVPSQEDIEIQPGGTASATQGQHQSFFPADIMNGEIELVTPDHKDLKSQPSALAYDDGTNTVLIAVLTNSVGQVINGNQVIYTNAFTGLDADLLYTYSKAGFEQDVVLREQPPTPESLGLNAATARLQVLTEFFNPPQPSQTTSVLPEQGGMTQTDDTLNFGKMQMVPGKAFVLGQDSPFVRVCKSWTTVEGRQFLVEEVPIANLAEALGGLPLASGQGKSMVRTRFASKSGALPPAHMAKAGDHPIRLAKAEVAWKPGVVLDYLTLNSSQTNYTFQGDTTYFISGTVNLYGTGVFEGGTIIKFTNSSASRININQAIQCNTGPYRPAIFTSMNDNSVGNVISGSTGSPTILTNSEYLNIVSDTITNLQYLRFLYAGTAIQADYENIWNSQFVKCNLALLVWHNVSIFNSLFGRCQDAVDPIYAGTVVAENLTVDGNFQEATLSTLDITNCIVANGANGTTLNANDNYTEYNTYNPGFNVLPSYPPFQAVGGASYYLTNTSNCHGGGTTNINPALLAELRQKTTYAPTVYANSNFVASTTLSPVVPRDSGAVIDAGYHYDALDYIVGGCDLSTNLTFAPGTDVGWFYSGDPAYGIACNFLLKSGANLTFNGTATSPCWMARFTTVQETVNGAWPLGSSQPGMELYGNGVGATPQLNARFSKWSILGDDAGQFQDNHALGNVYMTDSEFYIANIVTYKMSNLYFTNCLFYRSALFLYDQNAAPVFTMNNCTLYNGILVGSRTSGQSQFWTIENTSFDGTGFRFTDYYNGGSSYTLFNYNAYNTNNLSGLTIPFPYQAVEQHTLFGTTDFSWLLF